MNELLPFEQEKCRDPRRFPMHFRLKLDLCGIKLAKRDWTAFDPADRERLLTIPCRTPEQIGMFREVLLRLIRACGGDVIEIAPKYSSGTIVHPWTDTTTVPENVRRQVQSLVQDAANFARWPELSDLQRFVLIKLTEPGKLKPVLREVLEEFSLLPQQE